MSNYIPVWDLNFQPGDVDEAHFGFDLNIPTTQVDNSNVFNINEPEDDDEPEDDFVDERDDNEPHLHHGGKHHLAFVFVFCVLFASLTTSRIFFLFQSI